MQEIQYIDKKRIHLNSKYGYRWNDKMNSDVEFNKNDLTTKSNDILFSELNLCCCEIPYSFYAINNNNNLLSFSFGDITLVKGNYNIKNFTSMINELLPTNMSFSFNVTTGRGTFTYDQYFYIYPKTTCYTILGLEQNNIYYSIGNSITMPYVMDLTGPKNLYVKTGSTLTLSSLGHQDESDILHVIQNNVNPYGIIYYNNIGSNFFHNIGDQTLNTIRLTIRDDDNNLIDFNGQHWTISLQINVYKIKYIPYNKFLTFDDQYPVSNDGENVESK